MFTSRSKRSTVDVRPRPRRLSRSIVVVVAVLGLLTVDSAVAVRATAATQLSTLGFANGAGIVGQTPANLARELDAAKNAGATWIRLEMNWQLIEPRKGAVDWSLIDPVVTAITSRGLKVLGLVTSAPGWARKRPWPGTQGAPSDPNEFAAFAGKAAQRYSTRVTTWEVWNEPNLWGFYVPGPDPAGYTEVLKATYTKIKSIDPSATVLSGGLANVNDAGNLSMSQVTFLKGMYAAGAAGYMDDVALHPYTAPLSPKDTRDKLWDNVATCYGIMAAHGDGGKKIWSTEFGAPTNTGNTGVSEEMQSTILVDGLTLASQTPYMGPFFIYSTRNSANEPAVRERNFGVLRFDFSPKPAYYSIRDWALARAGLQ